MNINQAIDLIVETYFLQQDTGERFTIELVGGPGIGKSSAGEQACNKIGERLGKPTAFKPFMLTTVEPPDVRGYPLPGKDVDGSLIMQFSKAPWMPRVGDADCGIVLLDEFGQADPSLVKPAAELLLNGRVGDSQLPITFMVVAASNRMSDRSGVGRSLAFIDNRKMQVQIQPSLEAFLDWGVSQGVHHAALSFAKAHPGEVFKDTVPEKSGPFCTPRTLVKVSHFIDKLPRNMFFEAAAGYMGEGTAAMFMTHMEMVDKLPTWSEIVDDPLHARMPEKDRMDANYAVMIMVSNCVDDSTMQQAFQYLERMGKEFQVAALEAVFKRVPRAVMLPGFAAWARENKSLVMATRMMKK